MDADAQMTRLTCQSTSPTNSGKAVKRCAVCDQVALCLNFGILLCEPCKSFVRRNAHKVGKLKCPSIGQCNLKTQNNKCPSCRLRKVVDRGGNIMPLLKQPTPAERRKELRRKLMKSKRLKRSSSKETEEESRDNIKPMRDVIEEPTMSWKMAKLDLTRDGLTRIVDTLYKVPDTWTQQEISLMYELLTASLPLLSNFTQGTVDGFRSTGTELILKDVFIWHHTMMEKCVAFAMRLTHFQRIARHDQLAIMAVAGPAIVNLRPQPNQDINNKKMWLPKEKCDFYTYEINEFAPFIPVTIEHVEQMLKIFDPLLFDDIIYMLLASVLALFDGALCAHDYGNDRNYFGNNKSPYCEKSIVGDVHAKYQLQTSRHMLQDSFDMYERLMFRYLNFKIREPSIVIKTMSQLIIILRNHVRYGQKCVNVMFGHPGSPALQSILNSFI